MPDSRVAASILCDEIRTENTNKLILIGVYSGALTVPAFPVTLGLSLYLEVEHVEIGKHSLTLSISYPGGKNEIGVEFEQSETGPAAFPTPKIPFPLGGPGEIKISLSIDGETSQPILTKPVIGGAQQGQSANAEPAETTAKKRRRVAP